MMAAPSLATATQVLDSKAPFTATLWLTEVIGGNSTDDEKNENTEEK